MAKTISHCQGKGSLTHNNRNFSAKNVDSTRTKDNIVFIQKPIETAYEELFGAAVERYNAKQKRSDRKIKAGYFEHLFKRSPTSSVVTSADKRKSFYEDLVQIGTMNDTGIGSEDAKVAAKCLTEYMNGFQERNPNFHVFNAVLHMDEATPHLHIDYIPVGHYKQGVDTQNGIAQALKEMGYGTGKDAISRWREKERAVLEEICRTHEIEISAPEKSRGSLTVEKYKEYAEISDKVDEKQREVTVLENKAECAENLIKRREKLLEDVESTIDNLDNQYQEKQLEYQKTEEALSEKNAELEKTSAALADNQKILSESDKKVAKIRKIDSIETGKTVFGGKVTLSKEDFDYISDLSKKQIAAENKETELQNQINSLKEENKKLSDNEKRLAENNESLRQENSKLKSANGDMALARLRSERENLQRRIDKIMEFIKSVGLAEKLQAFLQPPKRGLHR